MSIYADWGFSENPFSQTPLEANDTGEILLIGRETEARKLASHIRTGPKAASLEGLNGVGKTSLINVVSFKLFKEFLKTGRGPVYAPCDELFQLSAGASIDDFVTQVFLAVAQTLLRFKDIEWQACQIDSDKIREVDRWLNSPTASTVQASVSLLKVGVGGGGGFSPNTRSGFSKSGFYRLVREWLSQLYQKRNAGGVVCIIDNLELLQSAEAAREMFESLRDILFDIAGIRLVVAGSVGIVNGVAGSPRMAGYLHEPIELEALQIADASTVLSSRVKARTNRADGSYLPITERAFQDLYRILNNNLRSLLQYADNYCIHVHGLGGNAESEESKERLFSEWIFMQGQSLDRAARASLTRGAWKVLDRAIELGGTFSPGDYSLFEQRNMQGLRGFVASLEQVGLLQGVKEDGDQRRKSILVSPKGYLLNHYRKRLLNARG